MASYSSSVLEDRSHRKVVFLGDTNVGKSSLIQRFVQNSSESGGPTLGAAEFKRQIYLNNSGKNLHLDIWDVSGQDKFRSMTTMYFRDADACIMVYDVTDRNSLDIIK
jgi:small GTP-binding protein